MTMKLKVRKILPCALTVLSAYAHALEAPSLPRPDRQCQIVLRTVTKVMMVNDGAHPGQEVAILGYQVDVAKEFLIKHPQAVISVEGSEGAAKPWSLKVKEPPRESYYPGYAAYTVYQTTNAEDLHLQAALSDGEVKYLDQNARAADNQAEEKLSSLKKAEYRLAPADRCDGGLREAMRLTLDHRFLDSFPMQDVSKERLPALLREKLDRSGKAYVAKVLSFSGRPVFSFLPRNLGATWKSTRRKPIGCSAA